MSYTSIPSINDPKGIGHSLKDWSVAHKWVGKSTANNLQVVTLPANEVPNPETDAVDFVNFKSALGIFEVSGTYDKPAGLLNPVSLYIVVPIFGPTIILDGISVTLTDKDDALAYAINIKSTGATSSIVGSVSFYWAEQDNQKEVVFSYDLTTPFTGSISDEISLFPTSLVSPYDHDQGLGVDQAKKKYEALVGSRANVLQLASAKIPRITEYTSVDKNDHALLLNFLDDYALKLSSGYVIAVNKLSPSGKVYDINLNFAQIFELVGSVEPSSLTIGAELFVRVPYIGRSSLVGIKGSLADGASIQATIDVIIASGAAKFYAKKNSSGTHDLYCTLTASVTLIGDVTLTDLYIYTLPF